MTGVEVGAHVESKDNRGQMPLSHAAKDGRLKAVKWLVLEASLNIESKGEEANMALDLTRNNAKGKMGARL